MLRNVCTCRRWTRKSSLLLVYHLLEHTRTHSNTLEHTWTHLNTLEHTWTHSNTLEHTWTHLNTLELTRTHSNTLDHTPSPGCWAVCRTQCVPLLLMCYALASRTVSLSRALLSSNVVRVSIISPTFHWPLISTMALNIIIVFLAQWCCWSCWLSPCSRPPCMRSGSRVPWCPSCPC